MPHPEDPSHPGKARDHHARRHPLRTPDHLEVQLQCGTCGQVEGIHLTLRSAWSDLGAVAELARRAAEARSAVPCPGCHSGGDRKTSAATLHLHAPSHDGWIVVGLLDDSGPAFRPLDGRTPQPIAPDSPEVAFARRDALLRALLDRAEGLDDPPNTAALPADTHPIALLLEVQRNHPEDPLAPLAIAHFLRASGQPVEALQAYARALHMRPDQPAVAAIAGQLAATLGQDDLAASWLAVAFGDDFNEQTIAPLLRAAWRVRRHALLQQVCRDALDRHPEHLDAHRAHALLHDFTQPDEARDAWRALHRVALAHGDRRIARVAEHAAAGLTLPLPPFPRGTPPERWRIDAARTLRECGLTVDRQPSPIVLNHGGHPVQIPVDLEITLPDGKLLLALVLPGEADEHVLHTLDATLAALHLDPRRHAGVLPIAQAPLPFTTWLRCTPCAERDLIHRAELDTDPTLTVRDDTVDAFREDLQHTYGLPLEPCPENLGAMDRLLARWHDGGFARPPFGLQLRVALWVATAIERLDNDARWEPDDDPELDPVPLVLSDGTRINLVGKVGRAITNGAEDAIVPMIQTLFPEVLPAPPPSPDETLQ